MPAPLRVLLAVQPLHGGVAQHVLDLVASLPADRFEIDLACPRESDMWAAYETDGRVRLHAISAARRPSPGDLATLRRLLPLVRRADVVHVHSSKAGFVGRFAALLARRRGRVLFTPNGWSFWVADGLESRAYVLLERLAARWCRTIVAVSEQERTAGIEAGVGRPGQYLVVPNGIDADAYAAEPEPVAGRVLMLGRLAAPKRQDLAIHAVASLREDVPGLVLQLAGDGPLRPELERLAAELDAPVEFLGLRSDVADLLREAQCVLLVSDYEGSPLALAEAMAAGVPVVVSRAGGMPEMVEDGRTGFVVEPDSADAIAAALRTLLSDPGCARAMGAAAREVARERYSRRAMGSALVAAYEAAATG